MKQMKQSVIPAMIETRNDPTVTVPAPVPAPDRFEQPLVPPEVCTHRIRWGINDNCAMCALCHTLITGECGYGVGIFASEAAALIAKFKQPEVYVKFDDRE